MAIPAIDAYAMPTTSDLPKNTAAWKADPQRALLLVHDMQEYFVAPYDRAQPPATELVDNIQTVRESFTTAGAPVLYTAQPGGMSQTERGLLADFWGPGMKAVDEHRRIIPSLAPTAAETVITKWRPSAFCRTSLLQRMREMGRDQIVITGVYAHVGLLMTAHDAFSHDIETFIVSDAIADFSREQHLGTLHYAASRCAVVTSTAEVTHSMRNIRA